MAEKGYRTAILDLTAGEAGTRGSIEERAAEAARAAEDTLRRRKTQLRGGYLGAVREALAGAALLPLAVCRPRRRSGSVSARGRGCRAHPRSGPRLRGMAIDARYGEPFVVKESMSVDDVMRLDVRSM